MDFADSREVCTDFAQNPARPEAEREKVRGQLKRYCGQDTEGMVWIVEAVERLCAATGGTSREPFGQPRSAFTFDIAHAGVALVAQGFGVACARHGDVCPVTVGL